MTKRQAVAAAPGPLEAYAASFDALFATANQRHAFRQYLEGVLLPAERTKTLTALANTEPIIGAQRREAQSLQWFLSESTWDPDTLSAAVLVHGSVMRHPVQPRLADQPAPAQMLVGAKKGILGAVGC